MTGASNRIVIDGLVLGAWTRELIEEIGAAGVGCVHTSLAIWEGECGAVRNVNALRRVLDENADIAVQVVDAEGIRRADAEGRLAFLFGFQNTSPLEGDLDLVWVFHRLGIRVMQLTYNNQSLVASGCYESSDAGITRFGREVIGEMNRVGMLIDLAHVGDRSSLEAIELSSSPVAITHANPRWFHDAPRNKTDEVLRELAARDGVVGVCPYAIMLPPGRQDGAEVCSRDEFCQMIAELALRVGVEHVAIGSDLVLDQPLSYYQWLRMGRWSRELSPREMLAGVDWARRPRDVVAICDGLEAVGFSSDEAALIAGGNWLRLLEAALAPTVAEPSADMSTMERR